MRYILKNSKDFFFTMEGLGNQILEQLKKEPTIHGKKFVDYSNCSCACFNVIEENEDVCIVEFEGTAG